jgi:hypothetical protein
VLWELTSSRVVDRGPMAGNGGWRCERGVETNRARRSLTWPIALQTTQTQPRRTEPQRHLPRRTLRRTRELSREFDASARSTGVLRPWSESPAGLSATSDRALVVRDYSSLVAKWRPTVGREPVNTAAFFVSNGVSTGGMFCDHRAL